MSLIPSHSLIVASKKALATFLFASIGVLLGNDLLNIDAPVWKLAASTGGGAVLNLIYRWAEKAREEG
jgi:hypothetical protein